MPKQKKLTEVQYGRERKSGLFTSNRERNLRVAIIGIIVLAALTLLATINGVNQLNNANSTATLESYSATQASLEATQSFIQMCQYLDPRNAGILGCPQP